MNSLIVNERLRGGVSILDLEGRIAIGESNRHLHDAIRRLVMEGKNQIILNLARVKFIDSTGLGEIVAGYSTLKANGGELKLISIPPRVTDLMTVTKLYTVFEIYENEADGIDSFEANTNRNTQPLQENFVPDIVASSSIH